MEGEQEEFKVHNWCGYSTERGKSWVWRYSHTRKWFPRWYAASTECCICWSAEFSLGAKALLVSFLACTVSSCLHKYWPLKWWWLHHTVLWILKYCGKPTERRESPESGSHDTMQLHRNAVYAAVQSSHQEQTTILIWCSHSEVGSFSPLVLTLGTDWLLHHTLVLYLTTMFDKPEG